MWKNILFFQISNFNLNGPLSFGLLFPEFLSCQSEKKKDFSRQLETDAIWLCTKVVSIVYERRKVHDRDIGWHYLGLGFFKSDASGYNFGVVAWLLDILIGPVVPIDNQNDKLPCEQVTGLTKCNRNISRYYAFTFENWNCHLRKFNCHFIKTFWWTELKWWI